MNSKTLLISSVFLAGCATSPEIPPPPVTIIKTVALDCGIPPQRDPIDLRPVAWTIIGARFTLSPEGYEDLGYNISEILKGVRQLQNEIIYYEECINGIHEDTD